MIKMIQFRLYEKTKVLLLFSISPTYTIYIVLNVDFKSVYLAGRIDTEDINHSFGDISDVPIELIIRAKKYIKNNIPLIWNGLK